MDYSMPQHRQECTLSADRMEPESPVVALRYQICVIVDFPLRLRPVLKCVLGRVGVLAKTANKQVEKLPWHVWCAADLKHERRQMSGRPVVNLLPLFLLAGLYASKAERRMKNKGSGKLADVFTLKDLEFKEVGLEDVFGSIQKAGTNFQVLETTYLSRQKGFKSSDLRYDSLAFLCGKQLREMLVDSEQPQCLPRDILSSSFQHWSGRVAEPKIIGSRVSAPFGADDILLNTWQSLPQTLRSRLEAVETGQEIAISLATLQKADIAKTDKEDGGLDRMFACMLSFARYSYEHADADGFKQQTAGDLQKLKGVIARNLDYASVEIDRAFCAARTEKEMEYLVNRDSEGTLAIECVYPILFRPLGRIPDSPAGPPQRADQILRTSEKQVAVLSGEAGQGKTTTLRHLAWALCKPILAMARHEPSAAEEVGPFPVFIAAWTCRRGLVRAIAGHLTPPGLKKFREDQCERVLAKGAWVILVDGFDDLVDSRQCQEDIESLVTRNAQLKVIVGTRQGFEPRSVITATELYVAENVQSDNEAAAYLGAHGVTKGTAEKQIARLRENGSMQILGNPLLLWSVALLLKRDPDSAIPHTPGELLAKVVGEYFLRKWEDDKERRRHWREIDVDDVERGLSSLAYYWIQEKDKEPDLADDEIKSVFKDYFREERRQHEGDLARQLRASACYSSLLLRSVGNRLRFRHNMLRDYFAACHVMNHWANSDLPTTPPQLVEWLKWDEVLVLVCGIGPLVLLKQCVDAAELADVGLGARLVGSMSELDRNGLIGDGVIRKLKCLCEDGGPSLFCGVMWLSIMMSAPARDAAVSVLEKEVSRVTTTPTQIEEARALRDRLSIFENRIAALLGKAVVCRWQMEVEKRIGQEGKPGCVYTLDPLGDGGDDYFETKAVNIFGYPRRVDSYLLPEDACLIAQPYAPEGIECILRTCETWERILATTLTSQLTLCEVCRDHGVAPSAFMDDGESVASLLNSVRNMLCGAMVDNNGTFALAKMETVMLLVLPTAEDRVVRALLDGYIGCCQRCRRWWVERRMMRFLEKVRHYSRRRYTGNISPFINVLTVELLQSV